jgi:hypothetical protein
VPLTLAAPEVVNPVHGGIRTAQVVDLERTCGSLFGLSLEQGRHFGEILTELDERGVEPVWDHKVVGSRYRRTDIDFGDVAC